jgi:long-subunit acyl-CoA synthetase (AMP-forming)
MQLLYTSGTTGFPKGVMHSQKNFVMAGEGFVARMWLQADDRLMCILPMFHINALFYSLAGTFAAGSLVLVPGSRLAVLEDGSGSGNPGQHLPRWAHPRAPAAQ